MAQNKSIFFLIFLALIVFSQTFESIEGRYLKSNEVKQSLMKHNNANNENVVHGSISISNAAILTSMSPPSAVVNGATGEPSLPSPPTTPGRDVSDFRPTTPGHSPGIGHSIHN
ncbi:hypothetical protein P8452_71662 [Trifolium repens]|jgi:hypothetical protein|nr:DNA-directed RNA polymerase II subunit RPB1 protein [Trifolium repens]WJX89686.1 hypothetical protein P8452_71662 [Trifolium repens]